MQRGGVEESLEVLRQIPKRRGLSLNEIKTHIVDATRKSFNFLEFSIRMSQGVCTGKPYPNV